MAEYYGPQPTTETERHTFRLWLYERDKVEDEALQHEADMIDWMMSGAVNGWQRILDHLRLPYLSHGSTISDGCADPQIAAQRFLIPPYGAYPEVVGLFDNDVDVPQSINGWFEKMLPHRLHINGFNDGDDCCSHSGTIVEYCFEQPYVAPVQLFSLFPNLPPHLAELEALQGYHFTAPVNNYILPFENLT